ncbi:MAG TPA: hypothetical protein VK171_13385 [Fimbriimonas sp.]|nr:hypothetical protein [Fimbriimonas sp.]
MNSIDIRNADRQIFWREVGRTNRVQSQILFLIFVGILATAGAPPPLLVTMGLLGILVHVGFAASAAKKRRFLNSRFSFLWNGCRERWESFNAESVKLRRAEIANFEEMPQTVRELAMNLYTALRRADILFDEVIRSEGTDRMRPGIPSVTPTDPQAVELYRLAEKNLIEYRANYSELMAGIQRTEAQATVFITTLDSLRVKLLGYRLVGKSPSLNSEHFLSALAEARAQLSAIDRALDELDLSHYPKTIAVVPEVERLKTMEHDFESEARQELEQQ